MRTIFALCLLAVLTEVQSQVLTRDQVKFNSRQIQLPYNRMIQPAGIQIIFGNEALENHALDVALSPDGKWLAYEEKYSILFISMD